MKDEMITREYLYTKTFEFEGMKLDIEVKLLPDITLKNANYYLVSPKNAPKGFKRYYESCGTLCNINNVEETILQFEGYIKDLVNEVYDIDNKFISIRDQGILASLGLEKKKDK